MQVLHSSTTTYSYDTCNATLLLCLPVPPCLACVACYPGHLHVACPFPHTPFLTFGSSVPPLHLPVCHHITPFPVPAFFLPPLFTLPYTYVPTSVPLWFYYLVPTTTPYYHYYLWIGDWRYYLHSHFYYFVTFILLQEGGRRRILLIQCWCVLLPLLLYTPTDMQVFTITTTTPWPVPVVILFLFYLQDDTYLLIPALLPAPPAAPRLYHTTFVAFGSFVCTLCTYTHTHHTLYFLQL